MCLTTNHLTSIKTSIYNLFAYCVFLLVCVNCDRLGIATALPVLNGWRDSSNHFVKTSVKAGVFVQDVNVYGFRLRVGLNGLVERPSGILGSVFRSQRWIKFDSPP